MPKQSAKFTIGFLWEDTTALVAIRYDGVPLYLQLVGNNAVQGKYSKLANQFLRSIQAKKVKVVFGESIDTPRSIRAKKVKVLP